MKERKEEKNKRKKERKKVRKEGKEAHFISSTPHSQRNGENYEKMYSDAYEPEKESLAL